ncbi:MAG: glycosyltransferase family 2 protein [Lentisphaeraceae bacterium]|nr:glycosyltransferase family 2 protein [Lentisphaeraceae bacterium]
MTNNLVSVIMPAYNCEDFIEESIKSVLAQTYKNWELLIVDDCSSDGTQRVINSYLNDCRITSIKNTTNLGGAGSRNRAIKEAKGRYIAFLDSDDLWSNDKLEKQISFMSAGDYGFTFSGYSTMAENGEIRVAIKVPAKVSFKRLLKHNCIGCLTAIYDTKPHGKIYMPLVRKRQDFALWLELLKKFDYAYSLKLNLGQYRIREGSLSASKIDAFKYYWRVLRDVAGCSKLNSSYNIFCYLLIVFLKKKFTSIYNKFFIGK